MRITILGVLLLAVLAQVGRADVAAGVVPRGKAATAFVELPGDQGSATAFCVSASGLFVTNEHVVHGLGGGTIKLVLRPGRSDQRVVQARILRVDTDADLALLQAPPPGSYTALSLGDSDALTETTEVVAFGYPFGRDLSANDKDYPAISVSVGRVTALRVQNGKLDRIQLDASLNPGNSGGPVLDTKGLVVGVVEAGIPGASLNFAVPVGDLSALLARIDTLPPPDPVAAPPGAAATPASSAAPPLETGAFPVRLPATIDDVATGGGGRYLILQLKRLHQLAVFDVASAKVVRFLPVDSDDFVYAAGLSKIVVLLNDRHVMQRWDLETGHLELSVPGLEDGQSRTAAMGYDADGPVLFFAGQKPILYDPRTMTRLALPEKDRSPMGYFWTDYRAGGAGDVFGGWYEGLHPSGFLTLVVTGREMQHHEQLTWEGYVVPSRDGSVLFTGTGLYNPDLTPIEADRFHDIHCLPSYNPGFFLGLRNDGDGKAQASVYATADRRLLLTLPTFEEMSVPGGDLYDWPRTGLTFEKGWHFFPDANKIITIPANGDTLVVHPFNLLSALDQAGLDYLFVSSLPPHGFRPGTQVSYQIEAHAHRGKPRFSLSSGPPGLTVSATGLLTWPVPTGYGGTAETVIVTVADAAGQQIYHVFTLHRQP